MIFSSPPSISFKTTRGRDLDITGLSYALLETQGAQQWPFPEDAKAGRARLYSDGSFTQDIQDRFEGDFQLRFHLAPPILAKRDPVTGQGMRDAPRTRVECTSA